jgi:hypothetical protein
MRRIIERIVTVVTTTTWKISWEAEPPQDDPATTPIASLSAGPAADLASRPSLGLELSQYTAPLPITVETKEVDLSEIKDIDESADE